MAVLGKKDRMVSFRLSNADYQAAERECKVNGVRTVSSLAHFALLGLLDGESSDGGVNPMRIARLEQQVKAMMTRLGEEEKMTRLGEQEKKLAKRKI